MVKQFLEMLPGIRATDLPFLNPWKNVTLIRDNTLAVAMSFPSWKLRGLISNWAVAIERQKEGGRDERGTSLDGEQVTQVKQGKLMEPGNITSGP
jgi:hypothetical protein